jgi:aspartyl-tRNA(Asn)/glutamyl-tRNA(Gln) amidotransferase subunit B
MSTVTAVDYEVVIGLEVHAQLLTASKMFCRCSASYADAAPNTHNCPICMGMPGVLPVINEQAVEYTVMTALALNCSIPSFSKFDRKNYFYPDLPKGYQISQYDIPLSRNGYLTITLKDGEKRIGIHRVHLEEDTGRLLHHRAETDGEAFSLVDLNRAGIPLIEIVSEPDIRSAEEARLYLQKLRATLVYLGVSSGRMEEGSLRCDANISVRPVGDTRLGTKTEIKNMNSFKAVQRALEYEAARQIGILQAGGTITQETRGWVEGKGVTVSQRSKEQAHDYRYFPEPDLPPLVLSQEWIEGVRAKMPELPDAKRQRFMDQYGLSAYDAEVLTSERALADYYEQAVAAAQRALPTRAKAVANWITGDLARLLNAAGNEITACTVTPAGLAKLVDLVAEERISGSQAKDVLEKSFASGQQPAEIVEAQGIAQISDQGELERIIDAVIADNPKAVEDFRRGKETSITWLIGQVMKRSAGRAKPALVRPLLLEKLQNKS